MAMDQVPDVMRRVGVAVLSHGRHDMLQQVSCDEHGLSHGDGHHGDGSDRAGYRETLQLLKHMFTWLPKQVHS